jgi:hypothetical protein
MRWRLAWPDTRIPLLRATVIFLALLCMLAALASLLTVLLPHSRFAVLGVPLFTAFAHGLWKLRRAARIAGIVVLVLALLITVFGGLGSLMESTTLSKAEVLAWMSPFAAVEMFCLYVLDKYKSEFK